MPQKNDKEQIIVFESSGRVFGLELDMVESIVEKGKVTTVPLAPYFVEGVVFYRNGVLPVISLSRLLKIYGKGLENLMVVVRGVSEDFGVSAERIYGIITAGLLKLNYISERENPYIQGTGDFKGRELFFLDFLNIEKMGQVEG